MFLRATFTPSTLPSILRYREWPQRCAVGATAARGQLFRARGCKAHVASSIVVRRCEAAPDVGVGHDHHPSRYDLELAAIDGWQRKQLQLA
jgi:hypothetical protein